jgi:peptide/nickel transport system substrate-binding protein
MRSLLSGSKFLLTLSALFPLLEFGLSGPAPQPVQPGEDVLITQGEPGRFGGNLVVSLHSDPKTLNPVTALDLPSKEVIGLLSADLIHINRYTERTEPALAKSWKVSPDGKRYTLELRHGIRFSDGQPFDADDVVFSFRIYLDENAHSPQRDFLVVGGKPIEVQKLGPYQVVFQLAQPYAAAERLFDSVAILPRHLLERAYQEGKIAQAWGVSTPPNEIAGLGPFRLKHYVPGQQIVLERNPYYWKADSEKRRLPYLDQITFLIVPTEDAEVIRFQSGDVDAISNFSAENYALLSKDQKSRRYQLYDLGPGLEYDFVFFNLNDLSGKSLPELSKKQAWFREAKFRQAVSLAIDREAIVRLVYQGRAAPLWDQVTPGNKLWVDPNIPHPTRSLEKAAELLRSAGFTRHPDGTLVDQSGQPVEFSILTNPSNAQRSQMAALIQDDLSQLGMRVHVVPLEFQAVMSRVFDTYNYEACVLGLVSGDADPNPEMNVWTTGGGTHVWDLSSTKPDTSWQSELDQLMHQQMTILDYRKRQAVYDRVQQIVAEEDPIICLVSPDVLIAARNDVGGLKPAVMRDYALWNADQLYMRATAAGGK